MGLDFFGIAIKRSEIEKYGSAKAAIDCLCNDYGLWQAREVFYARKGWELVDALNCDTEDECCSELKLEDWVNLMDKMAPIGDYFNDIIDAYRKTDAIEEDYSTAEELRAAYPREMKLIETYRIWYDETFDMPPITGYEFSVGYMLDFWEAADEVLKYLEDPDWEVWMVASY